MYSTVYGLNLVDAFDWPFQKSQTAFTVRHGILLFKWIDIWADFGPMNKFRSFWISTAGTYKHGFPYLCPLYRTAVIVVDNLLWVYLLLRYLLCSRLLVLILNWRATWQQTRGQKAAAGAKIVDITVTLSPIITDTVTAINPGLSGCVLPLPANSSQFVMRIHYHLRWRRRYRRITGKLIAHMSVTLLVVSVFVIVVVVECYSVRG